MIVYIIKSTISLVVLYGFYHFFLHQHKILIFNRIHLISSLVFSLVIPLISIPVKSGFTIFTSINALSVTSSQIIQNGGNTVSNLPLITVESILGAIYLAISFALLLRFGFNISNLILKIKKGKRIENESTIIILIEENIIPYSFFRYIFVNRKDYEEGKIEREFFLHEEVHCQQYHSIDVLILEFINVFLWFNPVIWLFRKAILLNHEYYADNIVISNCNSCDYQQLLISLVVRNNSYPMVSSIKNTLIKNRIIMMTKSKPLHKAILIKVAVISLILLVGVAFTLCQTDKLDDNSSNQISKSPNQSGNISNHWWNQIVIKHGIKDESFTVHEQFVIFGEKTTSGDIESFTDVVAISNREDSTYCIYKSNTASYNINNKLLNIENCSMNIFKRGSENTGPVESYTNINFSADFIKSLYMMVDH